LDNELHINDDASQLAIQALLLETAVEAFRIQTQHRPFVPPWLTRAKDFIHEQFKRNLTLSDIGAVAGVHPVHLARVFHQHYHSTIAEYLRRLRVESASAAMANRPDASLAMIAASAGFSDQSHFCKTFKRLTRMTPTEYRRLLSRR